MNFLGWIDHDAKHEEDVLRALGAAKGHDARDELGLGTIRDSFADLLFPGLSTIQQRARYFLFVQWCCELAIRPSDASRIMDSLKDNEIALIKSLTHLGEGEGVIGIFSQEDLERMPSEIYWNGLLVLGMRRFRGSRQRWARQVVAERLSKHADVFGDTGPRTKLDIGFDMDRPEPPQGFLNGGNLDFTLTSAEADFLRNRLVNACVDPAGEGQRFNLFKTYTKHRERTEAKWAWEHPSVGDLAPDARDLLMLAAAFANVMYGAVILYNVCVASKLVEDGSTTTSLDTHLHALAEWASSLTSDVVNRIRYGLPKFGEFGRLTRHRIDQKAINFVERWVECCDFPEKIADSSKARAIVCDREVYLKGGSGTSRIASKKARDRWGGESGSMMDFRWGIASRCLNDLSDVPNA